MNSYPQDQNGEPYKTGDKIGGHYEVRGELGRGAFGVVYLVFDREYKRLWALKTFKDEFLADAATRANFKKEALLWVNLGQHPNIVSARWVTEVAGRLFVTMDYIAPDARGCVTLADHLKKAGGPLPIEQVLLWAAQFCAGMSHACNHGIKCHRDIKPGNILIASDGALKISDFGLAVATETALLNDSVAKYSQSPSSIGGFSIWQSGGKGRCGTPGYMAPEVYRGEGGGIASDMYSFGLVLWQMAAGTLNLPFNVPYRGDIEAYMAAVHQQQIKGRIPPVHTKLDASIQVLLEVDPERRYELTFDEWHTEFACLLADLGIILSPQAENQETADVWNNKGLSLDALGQRQEAIDCFDKALALDPHCAPAWHNKGVSLNALGRREEAIRCYDKALTIDPHYAMVWSNKGRTLDALGRHEEAIHCYDRALATDPRYGHAWHNKGVCLDALGKRGEAIDCFNNALAIDPRYAKAWYSKGVCVAGLGRHEEASGCYDKALAIDPRNAPACMNKGVSLDAMGRREEAIGCYDQALTIDPRDVRILYNKGNSLRELGRHEESIDCYNKALALDPRSAMVWLNKAGSLSALGRHEEAIKCYDQALTIDPRDAKAWFGKGLSIADLHQAKEAIYCFDKGLAIDPLDANAWYLKALSEDFGGRLDTATKSYKRFIELALERYPKKVAFAQKRIQELN